ncbi:MAG: hypothetical protein R3E12_17130 [Candidatus Eisenbacteria bacterium]
MRALSGLLITTLCLIAPGVLAFDITDTPPVPSGARPRFLVGAASRIAPTGAEVQLAFRVPYAELTFTPMVDDSDALLAQFDLTMVLNEGRRQIGGDLWHETVRATPEQSKSRDEYSRRSSPFPRSPVVSVPALP